MQNDSYNRGGYLAFVFSMAFSLAFFIYVSLVHPGVDLKEIPDTAIAGPAAAVDVTTLEKPWEENPEMIGHGARVYANNCAVCHGDRGAGDGAAGQGLNPKPRNLIEGKWTVGGDSISLHNVVANGIPGTGMAAFGHLPSVDRWALVQWIRSVTENKIKDDPAKLEAFAKSAK